MAGPTPLATTQWDGSRGHVRWHSAWTAGLPDNLTDAVLVDASALDPVPPLNALKVKRVDIKMSGNFQVTLEYDDVRSGVVNTTTANTRITRVSGDLFDTAWKTPNFGGITVNGTEYAITTVDTTGQITAASDPGDQTAVAYSQDATIDRFNGQADELNLFQRDYADGPNGGLKPYHASSGFVGDILLTTSGVADGDELNVHLVFERK